jgi:hypothetical protein
VRSSKVCVELKVFACRASKKVEVTPTHQ